MGRFWRESTGAALALYLLLAAIGYACVHVGSSFRPGLGVHAGFDTVGNAHAGAGLLGLAIVAFLVWRVSRGGGISWLILFLLNLAPAVAAGLFMFLAAGGSADLIGVFALDVAGLVLLISPAAHARR